jgi:hypothetical protein
MFRLRIRDDDGKPFVDQPATDTVIPYLPDKDTEVEMIL